MLRFPGMHPGYVAFCGNDGATDTAGGGPGAPTLGP
jgi:hypothetical protein